MSETAAPSFQEINNKELQKTPTQASGLENTPTRSAARKMADTLKGFITRKEPDQAMKALAEGNITPFQDHTPVSEGRNFSSAEITQIDNLHTKIKEELSLLDKSVKLVSHLKDPEVSGAFLAAGVGVLSAVTGNAELGKLSMYGGLALAGAGKGEGVGGKLKGAVAGLAAASALEHGIQHVPGPESMVRMAASGIDDLPTVAKIASVGVAPLAKKIKR